MIAILFFSYNDFHLGREDCTCPDLLRDRPDILRDHPDLLRDRPDLLRDRPDLLRHRPDHLGDCPDRLEACPDLLVDRPDLTAPRTHVFLAADLVEHRLDLEPPVLLHHLERVVRRRDERRARDVGERVEDVAERRPLLGLGAPTRCNEDGQRGEG